MDGVLVDSERYWPRIAAEIVFAPTVQNDAPIEAELAGLNRNDIYHLLNEKYDVSASRAEFLDLYDSAAEIVYGQMVSLDPDTKPVLTALANANIPCAIASSAPAAWIEFVIDRFDLRPYFLETLSAEEIDAPGKPHPAIYERTCSQLGIANKRCIVIEDSEHGAKAGKRAGTKVIGFATGEGKPPATPQRCFDSLSEVLTLVSRE